MRLGEEVFMHALQLGGPDIERIIEGTEILCLLCCYTTLHLHMPCCWSNKARLTEPPGPLLP